MFNPLPKKLDVFLLEDTVWVAAAEIGVPAYDFDFRSFFKCRSPWRRPEEVLAVGRFGAPEDYDETYAALLKKGIKLVNSPEQHHLASELPNWYPKLESMTPRSVWFEGRPSVSEVKQHFTFPVFIKGTRQTSRHNAQLSIVRSAAELERALDAFEEDPILKWQGVVCREYVELAPVKANTRAKVPASFEFRTFWWKGRCAGAGCYWSEFVEYRWTKEQSAEALEVAARAAGALDVPLLVIDLALTKNGDWIVIECNDGQESGYAGVFPLAMWQGIVEAETQLRRQ